MKRHIKIAITLIGLGIVVMGTGWALGGNLQILTSFHVNKSKQTDRNIAVHNLPAQAITEAIHNTIPANTSIKRLEVDVSLAALTIIPHNENTFSYNITGNHKNINAQVSAAEDTLSITTNHRGKTWLSFFTRADSMPETRITVYIPHNFLFDTVELNTGVAEVLIKGFNIANKFTLNTGVGEVTIQEVAAANVHLSAGVGEVSFKHCAFTNTDLQTGIGELYFNGKLYGNTTISSGIGETTLHLEGQRKDYAVNASSTLGEISIDGKEMTSGFWNQTSIKKSDAQHTLNIQSSIGTVSVYFNKADTI